MKVRVKVIGTTPLILHNDRLSNPEDEIVKRIKEITAKKTNKTEKDNEAISKLEWFGGLYVDTKGNLVMPTANIIRCFRDAGAVTKSGTKIARALASVSLDTPLLYEGHPKTADELFANPVHVSKRMVRVGGKGGGRILRTRPCFPAWGLSADFELLTDVMNFDDFVRIAELAGVATGLCDARILGHGRFKVEVRKS